MPARQASTALLWRGDITPLNKAREETDEEVKALGSCGYRKHERTHHHPVVVGRGPSTGRDGLFTLRSELGAQLA